jgi:hypothetical protein
MDDMETTLADLVARLPDDDVQEVAETATSDFVRGVAIGERQHRELRKKRTAA